MEPPVSQAVNSGIESPNAAETPNLDRAGSGGAVVVHSLQRVCQRVLSIVHKVDDGASVSSVARWDHDDSTLVRVRMSTNGVQHRILDSLRTAWPLARVTLVENVVEGVTEAQVLVPSQHDQLCAARDMAQSTPLVRLLSTAVNFGFGIVILAVAVTATAHFTS